MRLLPAIRASCVVAALAGAAHVDVAVDWAKGLVTANGVGIADRHAPNPAVARGTSRRAAEDAARAQLAKGLGALPVAGGGTVGEHATPDAKLRLERAVAQAIAVAAEPQTDGAWTVTMAVPIEAIRQALDAGPRTVGKDGDSPPAVVIVDGVKAKPAIGYTVGGVKAATIWVPAKELPAWAKDAPHVTATGATGSAIAVSGTAGGEATLYVIVQ
ncbi:MAG TPA: hypothetical protein VFQ65_20415 [Kofleriaceae bacterium]|nr:hypothetical protein [Kofleriaceae bacterium]